ncbi:bacterial proteasome activator family protein [Fodinicola feengrottensis]|uniref:Bacterial proteasome activator n=1 Tax=Fodinicola feengrottensis TaxID=435914 RepID=A0ABN2GSQ1_9ACTN|nr:bacterial proteasome activator family protein [Fodinicola feengrottensis]
MSEEQGETREPHQVVVIGPNGQPVAVATTGDGDSEELDPTQLIEQPAKVMRIGTMIKQLLEEVRAAPLDEASRSRLKEIHSRSIKELEDGLAPELKEELERLSLPLAEGTPSESELRIAQAQLVGWLEGLFHGIQAALVAQQMAARMQLDQMRGGGGGRPALPPGIGLMGGPGGPGMPGPERGDSGHSPGTGQYL